MASGRRGCSACARRRGRRACGAGSASASDEGWLVFVARARPAELLRGEPWPAGENAAPAHGRVQHSRASRERVDGRACALALEEEDDLALADKDVVPLEPQALKVEGRPLFDQLPG